MMEIMRLVVFHQDRKIVCYEGDYEFAQVCGLPKVIALDGKEEVLLTYLDGYEFGMNVAWNVVVIKYHSCSQAPEENNDFKKGHEMNYITDRDGIMFCG